MQSAILKNAATGEYDMTWDMYGGAAGWQENLLYLDSNPGTVAIGTGGSLITSTYAGRLSVHKAGSGANIALGTGSNTNNAVMSRFVTYNANNGNSGNEGVSQFYGITSIESALTTSNSNASGNSGGYLMFKTKGDAGTLDERMRITSGGNVGIGTTNPAGKFEIKGVGGDAGKTFILTDASGNETFVMLDGGTGYFRYGNVGIGTTTPTDLLSLSGGQNGLSINSQSTGDAYIRFRKDGVISTDMYIDRATENFFIGPAVSSALIFKTNATEKMRITSGGNVGIGTTDPDAIFHVARASSGGVGGQVVIDNPASSALGNTAEISFLTDAGASGAGTRNARILAVNENVGNGAANLQFHTWNGSASAERMRITSDGNVLIGTTAPNGNKLQINGGASLSVAIELSGTITNLGPGAGTFTRSVWFNDTANQILFENARQTDTDLGTGRTVYFTWRGGPSVGGGVQLQHGTNAWAAYTSDARLKTKVADVENGIEAVMRLNPIKFKWSRELENSRTVTGFTAQNVEEAIPDAVFNSWQDKELGDVKSYYSDYLIPYLVKAIQELKSENDNLKSILQRNNIS
jgi:hypothetical protein